MPIYEYAPVAGDCVHCHGRFEVFARISDPELSVCPSCGQACKRLISAANVAIGGSHLLKESHFAEKGFTQYRRLEKGKYEKTAGPGPDLLKGE